MNIKPDCLACLFNQSLKVTKLLELDDDTSKKVFDSTAQILIDHDMNYTPPQIAKEIYQAISDITGEEDPVALSKEYSTQEALKVDTSFIKTIPDALKLAVIGNVIDFGAQNQFDLNEMIQNHFHQAFGIDDYPTFENELKVAKEMVIIGDNVGEHIFDKVLIEMIKKSYNVEVYYFVRGKPIINDVTVKEAQILKNCAHIIDTGVATPGYDLEEINAESKAIFDRADIVLAKGMGNFEGLYQAAKRPVYFLFVVKCSVVAQAIGKEIKELIFKRG
ncbi:damage-control phosphatase ARMT1 family protein [Sulfurovum sp. CS9]|uniref:damage-control phosphatase ARMT1 family protein n=1 Tax=Sulfurovum sp. CS9 TaxID=3391146 RepID=UPI0039EC3E70